jgi:hypothetical protein
MFTGKAAMPVATGKHDLKGVCVPRSRQIARIVGPTLIALGISEALNLDAFAGNAAPVVYLNGTLLFVAGLAIVQAHNSLE